jgi:Sec-independent protein translocase protein TatA
MGSDVLLVLVIVLVGVLIWRGPKTLPKIGQMLGRGVREARAEAQKIGTKPDEDDRA